MRLLFIAVILFFVFKAFAPKLQLLDVLVSEDDASSSLFSEDSCTSQCGDTTEEMTSSDEDTMVWTLYEDDPLTPSILSPLEQRLQEL